MSPKKKPKNDQFKKFIEKAREMECDEDEDRFNDTLKQIAKRGAKKEDKQLNDYFARRQAPRSPFGLG